MAGLEAVWYPAAGGTLRHNEGEAKRYHRDKEATLRRERSTTESVGAGTRPLPATVEPRTKSLDISETSVYSPQRRVLIDGVEINADRSVKIRASEGGVAVADIKLYNLDVATWASITQEKSVEIQLGWRNSTTPTVFRGHPVTKRRNTRLGDGEFIIRALAHHGDTLNRRDYSRTFNDLSPHRIVETIAEDLGLGRGYISTLSERIEGYYALTQSKPLKDWLNRLAGIAEDQTGREWTWYIENGDLSFHPAIERTTRPITLAMGKSLRRATPVGAPNNDHGHAHELKMHCEPVIKRGLAVNLENVADVTAGKRYRVQSYTFDSSTTTNRHDTFATVTPLIDRDEVYDE